jgi:pilus assembly protein CpaF
VVRVWVERAGRIERTDVAFGTDEDVRHAIERILAPLGRRVDEAEPLCDARLRGAGHPSDTSLLGCRQLLG